MSKIRFPAKLSLVSPVLSTKSCLTIYFSKHLKNSSKTDQSQQYSCSKAKIDQFSPVDICFDVHVTRRRDVLTQLQLSGVALVGVESSESADVWTHSCLTMFQVTCPKKSDLCI